MKKQRTRRAGMCLNGWHNNMPIRGWNYYKAQRLISHSSNKSAWQEYYDYYLA